MGEDGHLEGQTDHFLIFPDSAWAEWGINCIITKDHTGYFNKTFHIGSWENIPNMQVSFYVLKFNGTTFWVYTEDEMWFHNWSVWLEKKARTSLSWTF